MSRQDDLFGAWHQFQENNPNYVVDTTRTRIMTYARQGSAAGSPGN